MSHNTYKITPEIILESSNIPYAKIIHVKVKPNKPDTKIIAWDGKMLTLEVAAPPDKNKANIETTKFLKRFFGKPVSLIRGAASRDKYFRIR